MPEKPLTIVAYAAGASLAAVSLLYVFGPTFFLDEEPSSANRKKGVVGLSNPANDCFINSILQALAGLGDLRLYLIRETHRRKLDDPDVYYVDPGKTYLDPNKREVPAWKLETLQKGLVTQALKEVLDKLNERPIYRKTISAQHFVLALEQAFRTRISRQQQDAQEFLQVVTERLGEEYHAGGKARKIAAGLTNSTTSSQATLTDPADEPRKLAQKLSKLRTGTSEAEAGETDVAEQDGTVEQEKRDDDEDKEEGFPFEGQFESQIECLTCNFKPKPSISTFVTLTLNVPQKSSTTLNACFDGMLKVEHIDDYACDRCRLQHAMKGRQSELDRARSEKLKKQLTSDLEKLKKAFDEDPEQPPKDVPLPDSKLAPKTRIARHIRIRQYPKILAIHLSRSMYSASTMSTKNLAKVNFPETLPLGGILDQKQYRLLCTVTHKGGHNSGHYESFRRQQSSIPYATPSNFGTEGVYSKQNTPLPSPAPSPGVATPSLRPGTAKSEVSELVGEPSVSSGTPQSPSTSSIATTNSSSSSVSPSSQGQHLKPPTSAPRASLNVPSSPHSPQLKSTENDSQQPKTKSIIPKTSMVELKNNIIKPKARRKHNNRWWRISDEKIKECKTGEVLGMQKEVYLLFYELDRSGHSEA